VLIVLAYITQAHTADWTIYYIEAFPPIAFVSALGVRRIVYEFRRVRERRRATALNPGGNAGQPRLESMVMPLCALAAAMLVGSDTLQARDTLMRVGGHTRAFRTGAATLLKHPSIVFVRYAPNRNMHLSLVANDGDLARSPVWIVHDRGDDNRRLMALAPDRTAYVFDETSGGFTEIAR
jgi:hypothetical protein